MCSAFLNGVVIVVIVVIVIVIVVIVIVIIIIIIIVIVIVIIVRSAWSRCASVCDRINRFRIGGNSCATRLSTNRIAGSIAGTGGTNRATKGLTNAHHKCRVHASWVG